MKNLRLITATGFGLGYFPFFPGTIGSLLGAGIFFLVVKNIYGHIFSILILFLLGWWSVPFSESYFQKLDSPKIVIDEVCGYLVAMLFLPSDFLLVLGVFILYRLLDIIKPFGIKKLQQIKGALGVMADDIAAGILTNLVFQIGLVVSNTILSIK